MRLAVCLLAATVLAGCSAPRDDGTSPTSPSPPATTPAFIHIHAGFRVYVNETSINFTAPAFDLSETAFARAHLHVQDPIVHVVHIEGEPGVTLAEFFASLGVTIEETRVRLDTAAHNGTFVANDASNKWSLWVNSCATPDAWLTHGFRPGYQPTGHDRFLLTFAPQSWQPADFAPQFNSVPTEAQIAARGTDKCGSA